MIERLSVIWSNGQHVYNENSVYRMGVGETIDAHGTRLEMAKDSPECSRYLKDTYVLQLLAEMRANYERQFGNNVTLEWVCDDLTNLLSEDQAGIAGEIK